MMMMIYNKMMSCFTFFILTRLRGQQKLDVSRFWSATGWKKNVLQTGMFATSTLFTATTTVQNAHCFLSSVNQLYLLFPGVPSAGSDPHYLKLKRNLLFCLWMA
jgi:hypothetical protein